MTMMYEGDAKTGMKIAHENMHNLALEQGLAWDFPNTVTWEGEWLHGNDFDQLMIAWSLPAAMGGQSLAEFVVEGGLVDRTIQAGRES